MLPVGFKPTILAGERPQSYALDRAATGTGGTWYLLSMKFYCQLFHSDVHKITFSILFPLSWTYVSIYKQNWRRFTIMG